ncbi:MAG: hypothetical protein IJ666_04290 [Ruminococcus sp.]|nr:hypothetical protein [Ruminococcus sp.]
MQSTQERRKAKMAKAFLPSVSAELKKYDELYQLYCQKGYTKQLCEEYADAFINDVKKPANEDILQTARLYDMIHDNDNAEFYLDMLSDRKLGGEEKYDFCIQMLKTRSKLNHWRDAEDFRTENINFMQNHAEKTSPQKKADLYIALALADCAAAYSYDGDSLTKQKKFNMAFGMLMKNGYKPHGAHDMKLLEILITGVYICACSEDVSEIENAVQNAKSYLRIIGNFEFDWCSDYYEKRISDAAVMIL